MHVRDVSIRLVSRKAAVSQWVEQWLVGDRWCALPISSGCQNLVGGEARVETIQSNYPRRATKGIAMNQNRRSRIAIYVVAESNISNQRVCGLQAVRRKSIYEIKLVSILMGSNADFWLVSEDVATWATDPGL